LGSQTKDISFAISFFALQLGRFLSIVKVSFMTPTKSGLLAALAALCLLSIGAEPDGKVLGHKLSTVLNSPDGRVEVIVLFHGDHAVGVFGGKALTVFHLKELWWQDTAADKRVTLEEAKARHAATLEVARRKTAALPADRRRFWEGLLDPKLIIEEKDDGLVMKNQSLEYFLRPLAKIPDDLTDRMATFNTLQAYQSALGAGSLPAGPSLAVDEELAKRKSYARRRTLTIKQNPNPQKIDAAMELMEMNEADVKLAVEAVAQLKK
jgi:hypothetical protein